MCSGTTSVTRTCCKAVLYATTCITALLFVVCSNPDQAENVDPPVINWFRAEPASIDSGRTSQMDWDVAGADVHVSIDNNVGDVTGNLAATVVPKNTTTYMLTASNGGGSVTKSVTITVVKLRPVIDSFIAAPTAVFASGDSSILKWHASGDSVKISIDNNIGDVTGKTSFTVNPKVTTTYKLTATNWAGTDTRSVTVTVVNIKTLIKTFSATPALIATGDSATLQWSLSSEVVKADIDNSIGDVVKVTTVSVTPARTTTYTLTAISATDTTVRSVTVTLSDLSAAGANAVGAIPASLPSRVSVGLFSSPGDLWMKESGVKWDMRYQYFTVGWRNNWGWDNTNSGQWGLGYFKECDEQGFIPVVQYYCWNVYAGYWDGNLYATTQNPSKMNAYFDDFKVLMQRAKEFGKPVLVLLEADEYGSMEAQSANNPDTIAAVAGSGLPELRGLPNTVAGWGLAYLQIRKAVGASNVVLGIHVSAWATQKDLAYFQVTDPLEPEVDKAYAFLSKLGLSSNITGETYDVLVGDPLDRDADFYRVVNGDNGDHWWDTSANASVNSRSFNRYAEWLRLWNVKSKKRWVLWQIPLGNSNHLNVENTGNPREGYKDNRPEYFFGGGTDHLRKIADAGVIALLFGGGAAGVSGYTNDEYFDGQLFMKSRAGAFLDAGGLPLLPGAP